jgi:thioredoxin 1
MEEFTEDFKKLDQDVFDYAVASCENAIVLFTASWCGPCKMLKPRIPKLVDENYPHLKAFWVDIEECMDLASQFNIQAVPFIATFKNGAPYETKVTSNFTHVSEMARNIIIHKQ